VADRVKSLPGRVDHNGRSSALVLAARRAAGSRKHRPLPAACRRSPGWQQNRHRV